jgi:arylformamidase
MRMILALAARKGRSMIDIEYEREWSPSSCIGGEYQPYIDAYGATSGNARRQTQAAGARWQRMAYGSRPAQALELCLPAGLGSRAGAGSGEGSGAMLVFIHGGYWQELSAAQSLFPAAGCIAAGAAFAAVDYTLAPAASVADIVDECRTAFAWLHAHAHAWGVDAARIVVAGHSAGAHLAAMVALADARAPRPAGLVLVSGVYELEPLLRTSINDALALDVASAKRVSPALQPLRGLPPSVVCWGEVETEAFKSQGRDFASKLVAAGVSCRSFEVPRRNHFDVVLGLAQAGTLVGDASHALLRAGT